MALEVATYIDELVPTNPVAGDPLGQADDHVRLMKSVLQATLPNLSGAMTLSDAQLNLLDSKSLAADGYQKFPSGLIIQWGRDALVTAGTAESFALPIAFPTSFLQCWATHDNASLTTGADIAVCAANPDTLSAVWLNAWRVNGAAGGIGIRWIAIGY
jgi:hypothetical protein